MATQEEADPEKEAADAENEGKLPVLTNALAWVKIIAILLLLVIVNIVVFVSTWAAGVMVTLPFTIYLAFLLIRDIMPTHRFPRGRPPAGVTT